MNSMKIGYIVQQFYPTAYGSGVHAFELALELTKLGHELHIITKGEPRQQQYEIFKAIHIHRVLNYIHTPYYFPFNSLILWTSGIRVLRKLGLDTILGHGFETSLFFKRNKKQPMIYKAVGTIGLQKDRESVIWRDILGKIYFPLLGNLEKTAINHADFVIAISDSIKREIVSKYSIPENKIFRIYNGVNARRFHPSNDYMELKDQLQIDSKKIILFVGRLSPIKGPQLLIRAVPTILKEHPESIFLFLGKGPLLSHLKRISHELRVSKYVKFLRFVSNDKIPKYFAMADITVIPSLYEPFGLVALESLASGTPIISSMAGGLAEIHSAFSELPIIDPPTPEALAKQIITLLKNPKRMKQLGQKGRQIVKKTFPWVRCAKLTSKLLNKVGEK